MELELLRGESKDLEDKLTYLKECSTFNCLLSNKEEDEINFLIMKSLYEKTLTKLSSEYETCGKQAQIMLKTELRDNLLARNTQDITDESYETIKTDILKNRFKIYLDPNINRHRNCNNCDYYKKLIALINIVITMVQKGTIQVKLPECRVSLDKKNYLLEQLKLNGGHSIKHINSFKKVIEYVIQEYGFRKAKVLEEHEQKITNLKIHICKTDCYKEAADQIWMTELNKRIEKINDFLNFVKELTFINKNSQKNDNEEIDKLLETLQNKSKNELKVEQSLETLEEDVANLEARRRELFAINYTTLKEELENVIFCLQYLENYKKLTELKSRMEEADDTKYNKDDYYSFCIDDKRVWIRLSKTDTVEKSMEIKEFDKIRNYLTECGKKLIDLKVIKEQLVTNFNKEIEKESRYSLMEMQRNFIVKGISLCGYDTFYNGESLDELNSLTSVLIATLIEEHKLYEIGKHFLKIKF